VIAVREDELLRPVLVAYILVVFRRWLVAEQEDGRPAVKEETIDAVSLQQDELLPGHEVGQIRRLRAVMRSPGRSIATHDDRSHLSCPLE
jgi:hypothetical protein